MDLRIVILHRGWIVVGDYSQTVDEVLVTRCSVIRHFDHEHGIGGVSRTPGEARDLILDPCSDVRTHPTQVLFTIDLDPAQWDSLLK